MSVIRESPPRAATETDEGWPGGISVDGHFMQHPVPTPTEALAAYTAACIEHDRLSVLADDAKDASLRASRLRIDADQERVNTCATLEAAILYAESKK